ncbi:very long-chain-fatty-acid--CoA ligase bubblegum [Condylostylus longicornis]|uniref:very long-chain-fatty-acid--CoA ligase bubblegum n=1 Tax=Condylostylus longicornis TaxID=2530218 RepID=UPI00244E5B45|nr:very long-chain-fatty-acid--CoA ligase bubblegum [Condylostylus longicornis]
METELKTKVKGLIKPSNVYWTTDPEQPVKLRLEKEPSIEPMSIVELFDDIVEKYPDSPALMYKNEQLKWTPITYSEYKNKVEQIAKAFIKLGLEEHHSVGILAFNCPEWFISGLAAVHAHGIVTGIYTTNSAEAVRHVLDVSRSNIVIVDDAKQMEKIHQIKKNLPMLKAVVQLNGPYATYVKKDDGYYRYAELEHMNVEDVNEEYQKRLGKIAINECCSMVFTSGTTGLPKGAMITHDNIVFVAKAITKRFNNFKAAEEVVVSYLPLSHVAAQVLDFYVTLANAACTWFADRDALKGTLVKTLQDARPTIFLGVPRVYEKFQEKIASVSLQSSMLKKMVASWGKNVILRHYMTELTTGKSNESWAYKFARNFIISRVKYALGFDRCMIFASGAAPISLETKKYFLSLDMKILDAFGMSETTAPHIVCPLSGPINMQSCGTPLPGCDIKIINPDENGHGELCMGGRNIFIGYVGDEEKTKEALDEEGLMHSGDIAYVDDKGFVTITGRLKELIITAGGENVAPVHVEDLIKAELPGISNAMLVGDRKKFLTILLTIKTEIDPIDMSPKDELTTEALLWMKELGVEHRTVKEILDAGPCPRVWKSITDGIARANQHAISNAQKVQKFAILPHDFSIPTGELGPTLKLKRSHVAKMYEEVIESFYKE